MDVFYLFVPGVLYMKNPIARKLYCSQFILCKWPKGRRVCFFCWEEIRETGAISLMNSWDLQLILLVETVEILWLNQHVSYKFYWSDAENIFIKKCFRGKTLTNFDKSIYSTQSYKIIDYLQTMADPHESVTLMFSSNPILLYLSTISILVLMHLNSSLGSTSLPKTCIHSPLPSTRISRVPLYILHDVHSCRSHT